MEIVIIALIIIIAYAIVKVIRNRLSQKKIAKKTERERTEEKVSSIRKSLSKLNDDGDGIVENQPTAEITNACLTVSHKATVVTGGSARYYQRWDESYDKQLGYEWFKICTEYINFPDYNPLERRLWNIRKAQGSTQAIVAKCIGVSNKTLSAYENGFSIPTEKNFEALSRCYGVPVNFLKKGIGDDLISHVKLCQRYGEEEYTESLNVSVRAASRMFRDMLTLEDLNLCVKLDDELKFGIGFAEMLEKEKIKKEITEKLINTLKEGDINQTEFYSSLADKRQVGINVVKELSTSGAITKIPHGKSFILHLNN